MTEDKTVWRISYHAWHWLHGCRDRSLWQTIPRIYMLRPWMLHTCWQSPYVSWNTNMCVYMDGLAQDCSNSSALAMELQYIPRNMHTVFALLCFVVVIHWLIFPYPSGLLHWHCGNLTIAPVPAKQLWWIWINTSCEFIMDDCITTTKQSTTKPCAYFLGYTELQSCTKSSIWSWICCAQNYDVLHMIKN